MSKIYIGIYMYNFNMIIIPAKVMILRHHFPNRGTKGPLRVILTPISIP